METAHDPTGLAPDDLDGRRQLMEGTCSAADTTLINLAGAFYQIIRGSTPSIRGALLQYACQMWESRPSSSKAAQVEHGIDARLRDQLRDQYGDVVDAMLYSLMDRKLDEERFYAELWAILENPFLPTDDARTFALYYILMDKRIPYFKLDSGRHMGNDEFKRRQSSLLSLKAKLRYIVTTAPDQKTEQADLILRELDALKDRDDRIVAMAILLHLARVVSPDKAALLRAIEPLMRDRTE